MSISMIRTFGTVAQRCGAMYLERCESKLCGATFSS